MEYQLISIFLIAGVIVYLVYDTYYIGNLEYVKSTYDNKTYLVQSMPDKQQAANLLSQIGEKMKTLTTHLEKISPDDKRSQRIIMNFDPNKISEGTDRENYTSYSINKGERIVFCLRARDEKRALVDLNTMMFVAIHEMAHICSVEIGHTDEFWSNFKWLLEESIQVGVYTQQDFKNKPVKYCGINIESSPLDS